MIVFEAVDAGFGDCLLLRWTNSFGKAAAMLVDGGPASARDAGGAYRPFRDRLAPRLAAIRAELAKSPADPLPDDPRLRLDLVVCTHVDADHIAGIEALYECLVNHSDCGAGGRNIASGRLWFNSFSAALGAPPLPPKDSVAAASIAQGENLTTTARMIPGLRFNEGKGLIMDGQTYKTQFAPLSVTILNPRAADLARLRETWDAFTAKKKGGAMAPAALVDDAEPDQAIPNLSSIVMLIDSPDGKLMLTGDQRSDFILESLREKQLLDANGKLHLDILKVPHHGSIRNNQNAFIRSVTADVYIFCANGRNENPDPPVLEMIAEARKGQSYTLAFSAPADMAYSRPAAFQDGTKVDTLQQALAHLRDVKSLLPHDKVTIVNRDAASLSLQVHLDKGRKTITP